MTSRRIGIIACGVLEWNIERLRARIPDTTFDVHILPAQLHNNPVRLRELLQEYIDRFEGAPPLDGIVLAYGTCGRGTLGLFARQCPLVLPRAQDCIGIFLGSHQRHMSEFLEHPGTRYLTRGWYDKTRQDKPVDSYHTQRNESLYGSSYADLQQRYGEDNARYICQFRDSWKQNYRRAAYIRFDDEEPTPKGQQVTQALADSLNWEHQVIAGDESLLFAMMNGNWSDPRLLLVPPGHKTVAAPGDSVVGFTAGIDSHLDQLLKTYQQTRDGAAPRRQGRGLGIDTGGTYTDAVIFDFAQNHVLASAKTPTDHHDLVGSINRVLDQLSPDLLCSVSRVGLSTTLATNAFVERKGRPVGLLLLSEFQVDCQQLPFRFVRLLPGGIRMDGSEGQALDPEAVRRFARDARQAGCEAMAISGFGSVIDPRQELAAARIAWEESGLHSVCGHELTSELNVIERATTAAMNAKLIPLIESLIDALEDALKQRGLQDARIMVVKGDGSQLLASVARRVPVETVLS